MKVYASLLLALIFAGCSSSSKEYVCSPASDPEHRISLTLREDKAFKGVVTGTDEYIRCLSHGNTTTYGKTKEDCAQDVAKGYSVITFDHVAKTLFLDFSAPALSEPQPSEFDYDACIKNASLGNDPLLGKAICQQKQNVWASQDHTARSIQYLNCK